MTYEEFAKIALAMPGVTERVGRYEIDLHRDGGHLSRLRSKGTVIAIRVPWDVFDEYSERWPDVFPPHPHYEGSPYIVAPIDFLEKAVAAELLQHSWEAAPLFLPKRG